MTRFVVLGALVCAGCTPSLVFPEQAADVQPSRWGDQVGYDTDRDGRPDFFLFLNASGRADRIGYDYAGDGQPDSVVGLDRLPVADCRHVVIILDGFPYEVVKAYRDEGHLRLFHPPSKVVAPYPVMTGTALEDALDHLPCLGYEASYFDRRRNKSTSGVWNYLTARNEPWTQLADYRAKTLWDGIGYLYPHWVFRREMGKLKQEIQRRRGRETIAYVVSSAGVATKDGTEGQRWCLQWIDRLVNEVFWETRGLVKVTLLADHGHTNVPPKHAQLDQHLKERGWRFTRRPKGPRDVVEIRFGLVTFASYVTQDRVQLAADLIESDRVDLVSYAHGDAVIVQSAGGKAMILPGKGGYIYMGLQGDPLGLRPIVEELQVKGKVSPTGVLDDRALFEATVDHAYPDPLHRLYRAHFGLAENVPDVLASLKPPWHGGSPSMDRMVDNASTHGDLGRASSVTFIMSTVGPLPPAVRTRDIAGHLSRLLGRPFPLRRW